uniref:Putative secreted protein n=1 Tax=Ixodes ricinus TaxID=34613 RepID=A0A147BQ22_IXORI
MAANALIPAAGGLVCHTALVSDVAAGERHSSISSPIAWVVQTWCWVTHVLGACSCTRWRHSIQYTHFLRGPMDDAAMCEGSERERARGKRKTRARGGGNRLLCPVQLGTSKCNKSCSLGLAKL